MRTCPGIFVFWHFRRAVHPPQLIKLRGFDWLFKPLMNPKKAQKTDGIPWRCCVSNNQLILSWEAGVHLALGPSHLRSRQPVSPSYTCTISAGCCVLMSHFLASSVFPCSMTLNLRHLMKCPFLNSPLRLLTLSRLCPQKRSFRQELCSLIFHSDRSWGFSSIQAPFAL